MVEGREFTTLVWLFDAIVSSFNSCDIYLCSKLKRYRKYPLFEGICTETPTTTRENYNFRVNLKITQRCS